MSDKFRVTERMEVADHQGRTIGTVDAVRGEAISLLAPGRDGGAHHFLAIDDVERIEGNRVYLRQSTFIAAE